MKINKALRAALYSRFPLARSLNIRSNSRGQAMVEFTLVFMLLVVILWIPADFGLAFLTGQLAQNAAREGARIAAADPTYATQIGNCNLSACYALTPDSHILKQTALRVSSALLPDAQITLEALPVGTCMDQVRVRVQGTYNFLFFRLLRFIGIGAAMNTNTTQITRQTAMRWEHQC